LFQQNICQFGTMYIQCDYFGCMLNVLVAHFPVVLIMLSLRSLHGANPNFDFCHVVVVVSS
jgi:ABC-type multidrug transport system permease subunit